MSEWNFAETRRFAENRRIIVAVERLREVDKECPDWIAIIEYLTPRIDNLTNGKGSWDAVSSIQRLTDNMSALLTAVGMRNWPKTIL